MIRNKMEMSCLIRSLNELQKLKLLLFDDKQLCLFEHIPKPFLIDKKLFKSDKRMKDCSGLISSNKDFWNKTSNEDVDVFIKALDSIRDKEKMNIIDERLFKALKIPLPKKNKSPGKTKGGGIMG